MCSRKKEEQSCHAVLVLDNLYQAKIQLAVSVEQSVTGREGLPCLESDVWDFEKCVREHTFLRSVRIILEAISTNWKSLFSSKSKPYCYFWK